MASKGTNALATQEQIKLLVNSECTKRYNNLLNILIKFKRKNKPIYSYDIKHLKDKDNETFSILSFSFKELVDEASKEWKQYGFIGTKFNHCQLCGSNRLNLNYKIINIKNNKEMIIGSRCIEKFPSINSNNINLSEEIKKAKKIDRINKLNNKYENILDIIQSWRTFYLNFPIILPKYFEDQFTQLYLKSNKFYEDFLNEKIKLSNIDIFDTYIKDFSTLKKLAEKFFNDNKSNKYICDSVILKWINQQKNSTYLKNKIMLNGGFINNAISKHIYNLDFIYKFENEIYKYFNNAGFEIFSLTEDSIVLSYKTYENINIKLFLTLKEFTNKFSGIFFSKFSNNETNFIISRFKFLWDLDNLENYLYIINKRMKSNGYYLSNIFKQGRLTNLIKVEKNKNFVELKGNEFLDIIKIYINKDSKFTSKNISIYLSGQRNWKNIKEDDKYNEQDILDAMKN